MNGDKERAEAKVPAEGWGIFGVFFPYLLHGTLHARHSKATLRQR